MLKLCAVVLAGLITVLARLSVLAVPYGVLTREQKAQKKNKVGADMLRISYLFI